MRRTHGGLIALVCFALGWGTGCARKDDVAAEKKADAAAPAVISGAALYTEHCATCHMEDGSGVPDMQPGLIDSRIIAEAPEKVPLVVRGGSAALRDRKSSFGNEMPPFGFLTDAEVEAVSQYVRERFRPPAK